MSYNFDKKLFRHSIKIFLSVSIAGYNSKQLIAILHGLNLYFQENIRILVTIIRLTQVCANNAIVTLEIRLCS